MIIIIIMIIINLFKVGATYLCTVNIKDTTIQANPSQANNVIHIFKTGSSIEKRT